MGAVIDILMYHSISRAGGPTSIAPEVFAAQMQALAESGLPVLRMADLLAAREGRGPLPPRAVVITFDDGFQDFADTAWPVLQTWGFRPMVYLPVAHVGGHEDWLAGHPARRPLMGWDTVTALAAAGVDFGSHTMRHPNLDRLPGPQAMAELTRSREALEEILGGRCEHFAPPYGAAGRRVRALVRRVYRSSVSTRLGQAGAGDDPCDLPRLEMFYFTDIARWRRHLGGTGAGYLALRRGLRGIRGLAPRGWDRAAGMA